MARELLLEVVDLGVRAHEVGLGAEALDALHQHPPVPGAVEHREHPAPREVTPEAPKVGLGELFLGRGGDGDDAIVARVEAGGHPTDGAALSSGVGPLEDGDDRDFPVRRLPGEQRELALVAEELALVALLVELLGQVEALDQIELVDGRDERRGVGLRRLRVRLLEAAAQGREDDVADGEAAVARVAAVDHDPGRLGGAGLAQRALGHLAEAVVELEVAPVGLRDPPPGLAALVQLLEPLALALLGEVEPELEHQRALGGEHALEATDLLHGRVEVGVARLLVGA